MRQIAQATEFCTVVPNICRSSVWNLYRVTPWHLLCSYVQMVRMVTRQSVHQAIIIRTMQLSVHQNVFF